MLGWLHPSQKSLSSWVQIFSVQKESDFCCDLKVLDLLVLHP